MNVVGQLQNCKLIPVHFGILQDKLGYIESGCVFFKKNMVFDLIIMDFWPFLHWENYTGNRICIFFVSFNKPE